MVVQLHQDLDVAVVTHGWEALGQRVETRKIKLQTGALSPPNVKPLAHEPPNPQP